MNVSPSMSARNHATSGARAFVLLPALALALALALAPSLSLAAPTVAPPRVSPVARRTPVDAERLVGAPSPLEHRATVTLNPLALVVGRYGANAELVLAPHHAVTASGYLQTFPSALVRMALPDLASAEAPRSRLGGEIGYRLYTGDTGPTGLFIGPSLVAMPLAAPRLTDAYQAEVVSFTAYGAALDVGVQAVVGSGFTIGGGLGVMALAYERPASATPPAGIELPTYAEPHVLPRLLVMAGWAF